MIPKPRVWKKNNAFESIYFAVTETYNHSREPRGQYCWCEQCICNATPASVERPPRDRRRYALTWISATLQIGGPCLCLLAMYSGWNSRTASLQNKDN